MTSELLNLSNNTEGKYVDKNAKLIKVQDQPKTLDGIKYFKRKGAQDIIQLGIIIKGSGIKCPKWEFIALVSGVFKSSPTISYEQVKSCSQMDEHGVEPVELLC